MLQEKDYSNEFLQYARYKIKDSKDPNLTDKYLANLLESMSSSADSMIKNKQLATFHKESIPVYKQILSGRGYKIGDITEHMHSGTYTAPIFRPTYRNIKPTKNKLKRKTAKKCK